MRAVVPHQRQSATLPGLAMVRLRHRFVLEVAPNRTSAPEEHAGRPTKLGILGGFDIEHDNLGSEKMELEWCWIKPEVNLGFIHISEASARGFEQIPYRLSRICSKAL